MSIQQQDKGDFAINPLDGKYVAVNDITKSEETTVSNLQSTQQKLLQSLVQQKRRQRNCLIIGIVVAIIIIVSLVGLWFWSANKMTSDITS